MPEGQPVKSLRSIDFHTSTPTLVSSDMRSRETPRCTRIRLRLGPKASFELTSRPCSQERIHRTSVLTAGAILTVAVTCRRSPFRNTRRVCAVSCDRLRCGKSRLEDQAATRHAAFSLCDFAGIHGDDLDPLVIETPHGFGKHRRVNDQIVDPKGVCRERFRGIRDDYLELAEA